MDNKLDTRIESYAHLVKRSVNRSIIETLTRIGVHCANPNSTFIHDVAAKHAASIVEELRPTITDNTKEAIHKAKIK